MKKCKCAKWKQHVGDHFEKLAANPMPGNPDIPMYFGVEIDFCPWCGSALQPTDSADGMIECWYCHLKYGKGYECISCGRQGR